MTTLFSLEQFKRKDQDEPASPTPAAPPTASDPVPLAAPKSAKWHAFETDVRAALTKAREESLKRIAEAEDASKLKVGVSINAVLKSAGRGRTQLYGEHRALVVEIESVQKEIEIALEDKARAGKKQSKAGLKRELKAATQNFDDQIATLASTQMTDLLERLGPALRDRIILSQENETLKARITELEITVRNLRKASMVTIK